jgi:hypothetical protein
MPLEHGQGAPSASPTATAKLGRRARIGAALSGTFGTVAGITPHVLHHIGPIAGAAVLTGVGGTLLFGALGFVLMIPMLLRFKRRSGTWMAPAIALTAFALMFTASTFLIGPAIRGAVSDSVSPIMDHAAHQSHH